MATAGIAPHDAPAFVPREHGATAMMLTPFFCAAMLLRCVYWQEAVTLLAMALALVVKDPLIVLARQHWVWRQEHPETKAAVRLATVELLVLSVCATTLLLTRDWRLFGFLFIGAAAFTALAVIVHVRNRQRSAWFQVASAVALSATCIAACLSVQQPVPAWCWLLWLRNALQATAGIFVVHARLDARIGVRKGKLYGGANRRLAFLFEILLVAGAIWFAVQGRPWIAGALGVAALGYWIELRRQQNPALLEASLKRVGQQALALSIVFAVLVVIGLW
jgi:YwiC-like protein